MVSMAASALIMGSYYGLHDKGSVMSEVIVPLLFAAMHHENATLMCSLLSLNSDLRLAMGQLNKDQGAEGQIAITCSAGCTPWV